MNQPIVALYLFLLLHDHHSVGKLYVSILYVLQVEIHHSHQAHNLLHQVKQVAIGLLELEPNHIYHNESLGLVLPNNVDEKIPSHVICS